jgi:hypothetical protein
MFHAMSRRAIIGRMAMPASFSFLPHARSSLAASTAITARRAFALVPSIPQRSINADEVGSFAASHIVSPHVSLSF